MSTKRKQILSETEIEAIINQPSDDEDEGGCLSDSDFEEEEQFESGEQTGDWIRVQHRVGGHFREYFDEPFIRQHGVHGFEDLDPFGCFEKFFPLEIYELVAHESNRYATKKLNSLGELPRRSRYRKWKDLDSDEIKKFIAIEICMGMVHKPTLASYFQTSYWLTRTPGFSSLLSVDQYQLIR